MKYLSVLLCLFACASPLKPSTLTADDVLRVMPPHSVSDRKTSLDRSSGVIDHVRLRTPSGEVAEVLIYRTKDEAEKRFTLLSALPGNFVVHKNVVLDIPSETSITTAEKMKASLESL